MLDSGQKIWYILKSLSGLLGLCSKLRYNKMIIMLTYHVLGSVFSDFILRAWWKPAKAISSNDNYRNQNMF